MRTKKSGSGRAWTGTLLAVLVMAAAVGGTPYRVTAQTGAQAAVPNLLANPGFEQVGEAGEEIPRWTVYRGADGTVKPGVSAEVTDETSASGAYSLSVQDNNTSAAIVVYSDPIEVTAGQSYKLGLKTKGASGTVYAAVRFYKKATDNPISAFIAKPPLMTLASSLSWLEMSLDAPAPADAAYARVLLYTTSAAKGSASVDDVAFSVKSDVPANPIPFQLTNLGPQVHTINTHRAALGKDASGNPVAYSTMVGIPAKLLVIDVKTEKLIAAVPIEDTVNGTSYSCTYVRGLSVQPDGTVYMAGTPSNLFKYVPGASKVNFVSKVTGTQVFDMKNGPEGTLIGGTYSRSEAFEFNLLTGINTNLGRIMDNESYAYSVAYDEQRNDTYFGIGAHAHLIKYDRDTKTKTEIAIPERYQSSQFIYDMTVAGDKLFMRFSPGLTVAMDLSTGQFDEEDGNVTSRLVSPKAPSDNRIYYTSESKLGYYDTLTKQYVSLDVETQGDMNGFGFAQLNDPQYPGDTLIGVTREGRLFKYNPTTGLAKSIRLGIEGVPTELQTVEVGPDGLVHTSGYLSGGTAIFNPFTGETEEFTNETLGDNQKLPGSQTDRIYHYNDKVYYVNYSNMNVYEFDPAKPWDRLDPVSPNPRLLFTASDVGYQDRGLAGIMMEDGKLAVGTVPKYGHLGGALAIYDTVTDEREVYWNIVDQQSVTAVTYKDGLIYGGSNIWGGLGADPVATEAKLFIWDVQSKQKVFEMTPVPGAKGITALIAGPDGNIWGSAEGYLFIFDPVTRQVIHTQLLMPRSYASAVWRDTQFEIGTDGNVYGVQANQFFVIDAVTKEMKVIRNVGKRNWLSQDAYGNFYLTEGADLLKLTIPSLILQPTGAELSLSRTTLTRGETSDPAITALFPQGRSITHLEKRSPVYTSSHPDVAAVENGKLVALNPGTAEISAVVVLDGVSLTTNKITVTVSVTLDSLEKELQGYLERGKSQRRAARFCAMLCARPATLWRRGSPRRPGTSWSSLLSSSRSRIASTGWTKPPQGSCQRMPRPCRLR
ncbi:hypothetical protein N6H14_15425 [Paenibacillus sp. CC-CFT747]|nr:hypothetical protein N6H14_15425 [Paenibacillus sp. CC-CFT747]